MGVCAGACVNRSISLRSREARVITPLNSTHKAVVMAIERGKLQNLIFDNQSSTPPEQVKHFKLHGPEGSVRDEVCLPPQAD